MRAINWLLGYVVIQLRGNELPRFLRLCSNKGIFLWNVSYGEWNEIQICMRKRDVFRIRDILRKTKTGIKIRKRYGLPFVLVRCRKKTVYFICLALAMFVLLLLSQYVWRVEIVGNSYLSKERLNTYLEDKNWGVGVKKKELNLPEMEKLMLKDFPEIIWNSVSVRGTTLYISVKEQIPSDEIHLKEFEKQDLIAPIEGTVKKIYVRHGTAAVAVGDKVKKGDVLVHGWVPIYDDSNTQIIKYNSTEADADVYVAGKIPIRNTIKRKHQSRLYSGRERCYVYYGSLQGQYNIVPILYGEMQHTSMNTMHQIYFMNTIPIPIYRNTVKEREFTYFDEDFSNEELKEMQNHYYKDFIKKLEQKGVQITDKNVMISYGKEESVMTGQIYCLYPGFEYAPSKIPEVIDTRNDTL